LKTTYGITLIGLGLIAACGGEAALQTDAQMASYAVGLDIGRSLEPAKGHLDVDAFARGISDIMDGREPALADSVLQGALQRFSETITSAMNEEKAEEGRKNEEEGAAYRQENGAKPGVTTTSSGVQYEVLQAGTGPKPTVNDQVTVNYRGTLIDGTEFDSSAGNPVQFGVTGVIPGFSEVLQLMPVGSKYRAVIPGNLAYAEMGSQDGTIGPMETLIFEIELVSIVPMTPPAP
jgi:FKBP-type peptidyl-prolyl cis-trans isomerase FkpA